MAYVYSAQLTSQFAKPAKEPAIKTLHKLEHAMKFDKYNLYVENGSLSLVMLENNKTEIFKRLFNLMKNQPGDMEQKYLINSTKAGLDLIVRGTDKEAVIGGRETLLYNIRKYGELYVFLCS